MVYTRSARSCSVLFSTARCLFAIFLVCQSAPIGQATEVKVEPFEDGFRLLVNGEPYRIKGAGGSRHLKELAELGGNSVRTWGMEQTLDVLPEAKKYGLTISAGLWVDHERHGFDYDDPKAFEQQLQRHKRAIDGLKKHPEIIIWSIGNEVWLEASNFKVWDMIEAVAAYAKEVDPNRPTMTVLPHLSQVEIDAIKAQCPSIDILGINTYGSIHIWQSDLKKYGWDGPTIIAEWGTNGMWEVRKTDWDAAIEPTSHEKAEHFQIRWEIIESDPRCLGSYAFLWGAKQETTSTWFNLFLQDGRMTESAELLGELWRGEDPQLESPAVSPIRLNGKIGRNSPRLKAGSTARAKVRILRETPRVDFEWVIREESKTTGIGGDKEAAPRELNTSIVEVKKGQISFTAPEKPGAYRLFLYARDQENRAATANIPFYVESRN